MRIACAGSSGTGKTTIATWLAETIGAPLCPVGSRSVAREMGLVDENGEPDPYKADELDPVTKKTRRFEFQERLIASKTDWERHHDSFVADRTTLDNAAYTILHAASDIRASYLRRAVDGLRRYDSIIYFPASSFLKIGADPVRIGGKNDRTEEDARAYHEVFDALLFSLLLKHRPDMIVLAHPELESRKIMLSARLRLG